MKKLLLGSTALAVGGLIAAPAMAADPIKIGVGGYYSFFAIAGQVEGAYALNGTSIQYKANNIFQEGEIHFIGQTKLDNGTTVGVRVELEGWNPASSATNSQIDEAFMFAFGDWGRVEFGGVDMASYKMWYGSPSALINFGFGNPNTNGWMSGIAAGNNLSTIHLSNGLQIGGQIQDGERINYYTPRFAGFQVGVGYAPKLNVGSANFPAYTGFAVGPNNLSGICGYPNPTASSTCPTNDYSWQDEFDVGVNYLNKFGDVSVALSFGYMNMNFVPGTQPLASSANLITGTNLGPWKQLTVGGQLSYAGFTLGAAYVWDNNGMGANYYTNTDNDTRGYSVSLMYETGPWQVSIGGALFYNNNGNGAQSLTSVTAGTSGGVYGGGGPASSSAAFGTNPNAGALSFGTETASKIEFGANYALGPGIKAYGGGLITNSQGPTNSTAAQSWGVLLGMDLRF